VHEGCVGETLGALLAAEQRDVATDPEVRAFLTKLARDEERHAELAWRFVRWAIAEGGPGARAAAERAFAAAEADVRAQAFVDEPSIDAAAWRAHGRLDARTSAAIVKRGIAEIVRPCARALLGEPALSSVLAIS